MECSETNEDPLKQIVKMLLHDADSTYLQQITTSRNTLKTKQRKYCTRQLRIQKQKRMHEKLMDGEEQ
jgi:hypothetical protein